MSEWYEVTQEAVNDFAEVTQDFQWIHVDVERAKETPFGGTIAHGLFTLSLGPKFSYEIVDVQGFVFGVNYGYGKVRFPAPLPVGSRVRMRATLHVGRRGPGRRAVHDHPDLRARGPREAGLRRRVAGARLHRLSRCVSARPRVRSCPRSVTR